LISTLVGGHSLVYNSQDGGRKLERNQMIAVAVILIVIAGMSIGFFFMTPPDGPPDDLPERPPIDWYVFETSGDFFCFDPHTLWGDEIVIEQVYETLYTYPWGSEERGGYPEFTPTIPLLAASAPVISENGTVYTITLRQGITFHDGTPFNASVAVWNFKRAMKLFSRHGGVLHLAEIIKGGRQVKDAALTYSKTSAEFSAAFEAWEITDAVEATNTYEVTYRLEEPAVHFMATMTSSIGCMMSPTFAEKYASTPGASFGVDYGDYIDYDYFTYMSNHTCGTGPYCVAEWKKGEYLHLTLNENYWRDDATDPAIAPPSYAGSLKEIWFRTNQNWTHVMNNFSAGLIDDTFWSPFYADEIYDNVSQSSKDPDIFFRTGGVPFWVSGLEFRIGLLNWTDSPEPYEAYSPFHWRELRNMVAHILDYDAIIHGAYGGWVFRAAGPIPIGWPYQNSSYWTGHYDLETAVEYWNKAMRDPVFIDTMNTIVGRIPFPYVGFPPDAPREHIYLQLNMSFEAMKQLPQMNTTGLNYEPGVRFWNPTQPMMHYDIPLGGDLIGYAVSGADYADTDSFVFENLHSRGYWAEKQGYNNSEMDNMIMQGRTETDPVVRQQIYNQIQELAAYDRPCLWLYSPKEFTVFRAWLKGIGLRYQPMSMYYYIYHVYKDYLT
jgi:ABC-type transport system substrate-binding protein